MSNTNIGWYIFFWIAFTCVNLKISYFDPNEKIHEQKEKQSNRQNETMYISVLNKIKDEQCKSTTDKEDNTFYVCSDGTKISMIHWTRGTDRKGVVTREYDPNGNLILIYGHPDDVY